jgi:hypothetical protein
MNVEHKMLCHTVITRAIGIASKGLKKYWKQYQDNIQQVLYKNHSIRNITHNKESATS